MSVSIFCQKLEFVNLVMSMLNVKPALEQLDDIEAGVHKMGTDIELADQNLEKMKGNPIKRLFCRQ